MEKNVIAEIKKKKELKGIADFIVKKALNTHLKKHNLSLSKLSGQDKKIIIKEIRAELRNLVGRFQKSQKVKLKLFNTGRITDLLKTHSSTSERLEFYPKLREIIRQISPKSILDIGCGLNPIAIADKNTKYFASDINLENLEIVRLHFRKNKINGRVFVQDIKDSPEKLPKADLCLLFKVFDIIKDRKFAKELVKKVPCKKIIVSFSTKKLSGKPMNFPRRFWFEQILLELNFPFRKFSSKNEDLYLIEKS